jgi:hypothetical protein
MKKTLLAFLALGIAHAQWTALIKGKHLHHGSLIDAAGSPAVMYGFNSGPSTLYTSGSFYACTLAVYHQNGTLAFSIDNTNYWGDCGFIVAHNMNGVAKWSIAAAGFGGNQQFESAVETPTGEIIAMGAYSGATSIDFLNHAGQVSRNLTVDYAEKGRFIVKFDADGNVIWVMHATTGPYNWQTQFGTVSVGPNGHTYAVSLATSTLTKFYAPNGTVVKQQAILPIAGLVWALDGSGNYEWNALIESADSESFTYGAIHPITGDLSVIGWNTIGPIAIQGTTNSITLPNTPSNDRNSFITRFNSAGEVLWVVRLTGDYFPELRTVTTDLAGNTVAVGTFNSPASFVGASGSMVNLTTTIGNPSGLVVSVSSTGEINWFAKVGGTGNDVLVACATDSDGNVIVMGNSQDLSGGTWSLDIHHSNGTLAQQLIYTSWLLRYVVKYSSTGTVLWAVIFFTEIIRSHR